MTPRQPSFGTTGIGARTKQLFCQQIFEVVLSQFLFRLKAKTNKKITKNTLNTFFFSFFTFHSQVQGERRIGRRSGGWWKVLKDKNQQNNKHQHIFTNIPPLPSWPLPSGFLSTTTATTTTTTPGVGGSSPSPRSTVDLPDVRLDMPQVPWYQKSWLTIAE